MIVKDLAVDLGGVLGGVNRSSQRLVERSADGVKVRAWEKAGRPAMRSPGRPPVGRLEHRQRFRIAIAEGASSEAAAATAGVSGPVGVRWFREGGGMPSVTVTAPSGRYRSFIVREEIALRRAGGAGVREIARELGPIVRSGVPGARP